MRREEKRTVKFSDENNDDFFGKEIKKDPVGADYPFVRRGALWGTASFVMYRVVASPIIFLIGKLMYGLRIKNRRVLRKLRGTGFFMYGNHTQKMMDAYTPSLCAFPRRAYIVTGREAVSIPGIRSIVGMLGGIPVPGEIKAYALFRDALKTRIGEKSAVAIYPEAHIWPWYTGIRKFSDISFDYPAESGAPCVAFVATFRRRKIFKNRHPYLTVTLSDPFYPDPSLPRAERRTDLRDRVYGFMKDTVSTPDNYEFIKYEKDGQVNRA